MTGAQFRAFVERYSSEPTALGRIRDVADAFGWTWKRVHSYYYGERNVPEHIAAVVQPAQKSYKSATERQANAALFLIEAEFSRLETYVSAVEKMCRECEPSGECRVTKCPLRGVSPMPLARDAA